MNLVQRFGKVLEAFGPDKFPPPLLIRVEERTKDLSQPEMDELCNLLIDNCERVPSMLKVVSYASYIRARRPQQQILISGSTDECPECNDLGLFRVEKAEHDFLMRCPNIYCRPSYYWELPRWSAKFGAEFKKSKCPVEWFKPTQDESFNEKRDNWKIKIQIANAISKELGLAIETKSMPPRRI